VNNAESKCGTCGSATESVICWRCARDLRHLLVGDDSIPGADWFIVRLNESAYGQGKLGDRFQPREGGESISHNFTAAVLLRDGSANLRRWSEQAFGRRVDAAPEVICHILAHNIGRVMGLDSAPSMMGTLSGFNRKALQAINRPPSVYCGPCRATLHSGETCGYELRAEEDDQFVECRRCRAIHDVEAIRNDLMSRVYDEPQPAAALLRIMRWLGMDIRKAEFYSRISSVNPRMYAHADGRRNLRREPDSVALYAYRDVLAALNDGDAVSPEDNGTRRQRRRPRRNLGGQQ
jgi:hypothetical protein